MAWDRQTRGLTQRKQEKPSIKKNRPLKSEGNDGDITIRQLKDGVFLYFKALGKWYKTLNTSSQVIPEPDAPRSFTLGAPAQPVESMYVSSNSIHIGNTKSTQAKITSDGDDLKIVQKGTTAERPILSSTAANWIDIGGDAKNKNFLLTASSASAQAKFTHSTASATSLLYFITSLSAVAFDNYIRLKDNSDPGTPTSGYGYLYAKSDGLHYKNDAAVVYDLIAGSVIGYTKIQNLTGSSGNEIITIGTSMTVLQTNQGTDVSITFITPPSENVEIEFKALVAADAKNVEFGLSDSSTYHVVADSFEYELALQSPVKNEGDDAAISTVQWVLAAANLAAIGSSNTYYIGAKSSGASSYIYHGIKRIGTNHAPPIIVKATALPETIVTGE